MGEVEIRKMRATDLEGAMDVLKKWNMAPMKPGPDNPNPERSSIDIENSFVAVDSGRIVGVSSYIRLSEDVAETASLAVAPDCRGKGIGYALQAARLKEMKQKGFRRVRTETDRPETIEWYIRKFGYVKTGTNRKKHDFSLPDVDIWTVLELDLDEYAR